MESWKENLTVEGCEYTLTFRKRPFREGLEVEVQIGAELHKIAEFGLGKAALIEKVSAQVRNYLKTQGSKP